MKQSPGLFCVVRDVLLRRVCVSDEKRQKSITVPFLVVLKSFITVFKGHFAPCALYSSLTETECFFSFPQIKNSSLLLTDFISLFLQT